MIRSFYYTRESDEPIVHDNYLNLYCNAENQCTARVADVIESLDRQEIYLHDEDLQPVGVLFLAIGYDMHYGRVCQVVAQWVHPMQRHKDYQKDMVWYMIRFCQTFNCKYYQRSRHVSPTRQLIITKEI